VPENVNRNYSGYAPPRKSIVKCAFVPAATPLQEIHHAGWIHLPVIWFGVNEHRPRANVANGIHRRDKGEGRDEDLIPGLHAGKQQRHVQGRGPINGSDSEARADPGSDFTLEPVHEGTRRRHPVRIEALLDVAPLVSLDRGNRQGDEVERRRCFRL
jgi:hypothetical protein